MKVAIVHYWLITKRGGEKVLESILKIYPDADIYTLFYDPNIYGDTLKGHKVYTSILDRSFLRKHYQKIFPLYPLGIASLKLRKEYDLIISSESGPAKGINNPNNSPHICYIHSPMRYCWGFTEDYLNSVNKYLRPFLRILFSYLRKWDLKTVNNVDLYIANSQNIANRVKNYYNRSCKIVYPPIDNSFFDKETIKLGEKKYFLSFGAITPYKRVDLLVDTFNKNGESLIVIGTGSEIIPLQKRAKKNIEFKGNLNWKAIEEIFKNTRALIFPGEEDFGMIPLEVMAYGIPVLAFKKGGALETVVENLNNISESSGLFFDSQTVESISGCIDNFVKIEKSFDNRWIKRHAEKYKEDIFLDKLSIEVNLFLEDKIKES